MSLNSRTQQQHLRFVLLVRLLSCLLRHFLLSALTPWPTWAKWNQAGPYNVYCQCLPLTAPASRWSDQTRQVTPSKRRTRFGFALEMLKERRLNANRAPFVGCTTHFLRSLSLTHYRRTKGRESQNETCFSHVGRLWTSGNLQERLRRLRVKLVATEELIHKSSIASKILLGNSK